MIKYYEDIEYSHILEDVINTLLNAEQFIMKVWVDGSEVPFTIDDSNDVEFLKEALKVSRDNETTWILYGIIMAIRVNVS